MLVTQPWPDDGPFTSQQALSFTTRGRLRGRGFRRLLPDVYLPASVEPTFAHRIAAWRLRLGPDAVFGGLTAAFVLGVPWFAAPDLDIEVIQPIARRAGPHAGLRVRGDILGADEVVRTGFGLVTGGVRTAYDLSRRGRLARAVGAADAVLRATGATARELREIADRCPGARNITQARVVAQLADPRAESLPESELRVALIEAGAWGLVPQYVVRDDGEFVARLDLANPALKVGLEYDGSHHREQEQFSRDLQRHNRLRALNWNVIRVDGVQRRELMRTADGIRRMVPQLFARESPAQTVLIAQFREYTSHQRRTRARPLRQVRP